jgi:uncharacterized protein YndB with AHSA1/START domain
MMQVDERMYGSLELGERPTLRYERLLRHPPDKVWRALTEDQHLAAWFPTTIDGERAAGAPLAFRFEQVTLHPMQGEVTAFEPPSLLEFTWGTDRLRFELAPDGGGTSLTLTVVLEELGKATRDGTGWHQCLDSLERALEDQPERPDDMARWLKLREDYAERFGPDASTIGPPPGVYDD